MMKINGIYLEKINDDEFKVREFNEKKKMFYIANYTKDELEIFFNIKKEDLK